METAATGLDDVDFSPPALRQQDGERKRLRRPSVRILQPAQTEALRPSLYSPKDTGPNLHGEPMTI
ncbi:hypothetical protein CC80DRAFT_554820 [Byssothecium circinans]|uniref:Uncharacterized protein n=1 Tax=Byssothecium circinans TaxID=147558 RepID=A0A6A5TCB8_9PLEO|nr:hypothetical protein CC80DRAFT_554820 [Byssothecium circinans]